MTKRCLGLSVFSCRYWVCLFETLLVPMLAQAVGKPRKPVKSDAVRKADSDCLNLAVNAGCTSCVELVGVDAGSQQRG